MKALPLYLSYDGGQFIIVIQSSNSSHKYSSETSSLEPNFIYDTVLWHCAACTNKTG